VLGGAEAQIGIDSVFGRFSNGAVLCISKLYEQDHLQLLGLYGILGIQNASTRQFVVLLILASEKAEIIPAASSYLLLTSTVCFHCFVSCLRK